MRGAPLVIFIFFIGVLSTCILNSFFSIYLAFFHYFSSPFYPYYHKAHSCSSSSSSSSSFSLSRTSSSSATCPDYFRWIHKDLGPWRETGITREIVRRGVPAATFRLAIVNGSAYIRGYRKSFQSRDVFTVWGILQLLRRYQIPDLELLFNCEDEPAVPIGGPNGTAVVELRPPPLFGYCTSDSTLDIPFPDWSFWGWPWEGMSKELQEGNKRRKWVEREPYAYWKGNPSVSNRRKDLVVKCNASSPSHDWGARLFSQNWTREEHQGFSSSNLASQCTHRYKIYIEGRTWSVSEKYILACNSPTLMVKPTYMDFFSRGLVAMKHYWPIRDDGEKCRSIKDAVYWGNTHPEQAQEIGRAGSKFIEEELKMDYVYDYMFHLLSEYGKLMKYKPSLPPAAAGDDDDEGYQLITSEHILSVAPPQGLVKQFMIESLVKAPSITPPCTMS
ncbi:unnamed protein product [Cuscuta epithymum]|uniref:Glycosyl transferase CAP10 domain-containing protein n=1 Tax=Cuscuta epithymum TaxID=186058 RepID=A0AAV0ED69_9ASTE|nr:unnamed protein product [Cuscuta epithymum]